MTRNFFSAIPLALVLAFTACTSFKPLAAGSGEVAVKREETTAETIFGFLPISNDCTILKAAQNGGIQHIATVDVKNFTFLGLYNSTTTIVTGD